MEIEEWYYLKPYTVNYILKLNKKIKYMKIKTLISSMAVAGCILAGSTFTADAQISQQQIEARLNELLETHPEAPNFTLKDTEGKDVSLSDFRGHWVVLDFWGSWCGWCIRGLPEMKEAYHRLKDKGVVFIGIDCNDPEEQWRAAIAKYEIPWINLYNPYDRGGEITASYGVLGFPTKAIIDPEGKIYDIVVGEDPIFYDTLFRAVGVER